MFKFTAELVCSIIYDLPRAGMPGTLLELEFDSVILKLFLIPAGLISATSNFDFLAFNLDVGFSPSLILLIWCTFYSGFIFLCLYAITPVLIVPSFY